MELVWNTLSADFFPECNNLDLFKAKLGGRHYLGVHTASSTTSSLPIKCALTLCFAVNSLRFFLLPVTDGCGLYTGACAAFGIENSGSHSLIACLQKKRWLYWRFSDTRKSFLL